MTKLICWMLGATIIASGVITAGMANAQVRGREIVPKTREGHFPEGRGCYWANGRGSCRAYCYIEADGRRFCTDRSRYAEPQAPFGEGNAPEDARRLK